MKTMWLFLALVAGTISFNSVARSDFDHDQIRQLVDQGKILSLDAILKKYPQHNLGRLLDLEVECEHGLIIYELEFLQKNGDVIELVIDAATGKLLEQEID